MSSEEDGDDLVEIGMVACVVLEIGIQQLIAGPDHQGGSELGRSPSGVVLDVASGHSPGAGDPLAGPQQRGGSERLGPDDVGRRAVLVQQDLERDSLVLDECLGVTLPAGADGNDAGTRCGDLFVSVSDLTGPLTTGKSTKVPEEEDERTPFRPPVTQAMERSVGIDELMVCEPGDVEGHESAGITSRANSSRPDVS